MDVPPYIKRMDKLLEHINKGKFIVYRDNLLVVFPGVLDPYIEESTNRFLELFSMPSFNYSLNSDMKVLEIGTGCGVLGIDLIYRGIRNIVLADNSELACRNTRYNLDILGIKDVGVVCCDLFPPFNESKYDLIVFNAPLIHPLRESEEYSSMIWSNNISLLHDFMEGLERYLKEDGLAYVAYVKFKDFDPLPLHQYSGYHFRSLEGGDRRRECKVKISEIRRKISD